MGVFLVAALPSKKRPPDGKKPADSWALLWWVVLTAPHKCLWILQMLWWWQGECFSLPSSEGQLFAGVSQSTQALLSTAGVSLGELWGVFLPAWNFVIALWGRKETLLFSLAQGDACGLWLVSWADWCLANKTRPCHGASGRNLGWPPQPLLRLL